MRTPQTITTAGALLLLTANGGDAFSIVPNPSTANRSPLRRGNPSMIATAPLFATANGDATSQPREEEEQQKHEIWLLDEVDSIFGCLDQNGDGEITPDELEKHMVDEMGYSLDYTRFLFESIDTDSNGSISREELGFAFYNFEALSLYATLGLGGAELTQRPGFQKLLRVTQEGTTRDKLLLDDLADLVFELIDADGSGEITQDELRDHFGSVTTKLAARSGGAAATVQQANEYVSTIFETLDANRDGTICRDEVRAAFEKYDFKLLARTFGLRVYQSAAGAS